MFSLKLQSHWNKKIYIYTHECIDCIYTILYLLSDKNTRVKRHKSNKQNRDKKNTQWNHTEGKQIKKNNFTLWLLLANEFVFEQLISG